MGYQIFKIQNAHENPTIIVDDTMKDWPEIYEKYLTGANPTDSKEWKNGIIALTKLIEK